MRRSRLFAWLPWLLLFLPAPALGDAIAVRGLVTDAERRPIAEARAHLFPIEDAHIEASRLLDGQLEPEPAATASTDEAGRFRLAAPGPGMWRLVVEAAGWAPAELLLRPLVEPVDLPPARLLRNPGLAVQVTADSAPVAGALVEAEAEPDGEVFGPTLEWRQPPLRATTGEDGLARLPRGEGERLRLRVAAPGFPMVERRDVPGTRLAVALPTGERRPVRVEGPGRRPTAGAVLRSPRGGLPLAETDEDGNAVIVSRPGEPSRVLVLGPDGARLTVTVAPRGDANAPPQHLELPPMASAAGRVIDARSRTPIPRAVVWLAEAPERAALTDGAGAFELVASRTGEARLMAASGGYFQASRSLHRDRAGEVEPVALALDPVAAIEGVVVDPRGDPLEGVEVWARLDIRHRHEGFRPDVLDQGRTDAAGRFRLPRLVPEALYEVVARLPGFAPARETAPSLEPHGTARMRLVLESGCVGMGRVVDVEGEPIAGAQVRLEIVDTTSPPGLFVRVPGGAEPPAGESETDSEGRFRLPDLPTGSFELTARAPGFAATRVPGIEVAEPVATVDLGTVVLAQGAPIEGRVVDRDGRPVAGAEVYAFDGGRAPTGPLRFPLWDAEPPVTTAADGFFRSEERPAGVRVDLVARHGGYGIARLGGVPAPTAEPVLLRLIPSSRIAGQVRDADGRSVAGARIEVSFERRTPTSSIFGTAGGAHADDDGRFEIEDVEAERYLMRTHAAGFLAASLEVEVPTGADLDGIEIVLSRGASVSGLVRSEAGAPVIGAVVAWVPEERLGGSGRRPIFATSDGDGRYRLEGIEPGERQVSVRARGFSRALSAVVVEPGDNRFDLVLEDQGHPVSGVVRDPRGEPLAAANVHLAAVGDRSRGTFTATTGGEGRFTIDGVPDGTYRATASHLRFASGRETVEVAGAPLTAVVLSVAPAAILTGELLGLSFEELGRAAVSAGSRRGLVLHDGTYRIEGLGPGEWPISGRVDGGNRRASGRIRIEEGQERASLDLDFDAGVVLTGRVRHLGEPLAEAGVSLLGLDRSATGSGHTDQNGRFRLDGLSPARYSLSVGHIRLGLQHREVVDLRESDHLEIDLVSAPVRALVRDAESDEPVGGALARLEPEGESDGHFHSQIATTDSRGSVSLGRLSAGRWRLEIEGSGYAQAEQWFSVAGQSPVEIEVRLDPTEGISLELRTPSGDPPRSALVALVDGAGTAVTSGTYAVGEAGRLRLSSAPPGTWAVTVAAPGFATASVTATSPGPVVAVSLEPEAILVVRVPELAESTEWARLAAVGPDGRPHLFLDWGPPSAERVLTRGHARLAQLPAGPWALTVTAPDGRSWSATTVAVANEITEVVLE